MQSITPQTPHWAQIAHDVLTKGGVVLHPTDTAYGLAVDATNPHAIQRVFQPKQRQDKPLIMVVHNLDQARKYMRMNDLAQALITQFFPGALTLVLPKKKVVPNELTCGLSKVGIRQPDYSVTRELSRIFPRPYTSTSANLSGGPTPYTVQAALTQLDKSQIDLVIDVGPLPVRPTSTVVDLTVTPPRILRSGAIADDEIFAICKLFQG